MKKFFLLIVSLMIPFGVSAETLQDKYDELADLQVKYNTNKTQKQLTNNQIKQLNGEIYKISLEIEKIRKEIKQAEIDIEDSKKKIEDKKVETDGLLQFLQISSGGNVYLKYLFEAENYTDFIYRYEVVKQLTNYNSDLIDELEKLILDLKEKEKELSQKNVTLENRRRELNRKVNTLTYNLKSLNSVGGTIEEDIRDLKEVIHIYNELGCKREQDLNDCTGMVNAFGWNYPLKWGCVTSEYTGFHPRHDWSGGGGHHGIDLDCVGEGTKVYAAAAGVVSLTARYNCGGNAVYIKHIVNGKKYTTVYMHLLNISKNIKTGSVVTNKTIIGTVGGYSTAINHGGYDRCTTGAHLHFGIAEGYHTSNFNSYSINPREKYNFPGLGRGYFHQS